MRTITTGMMQDSQKWLLKILSSQSQQTVTKAQAWAAAGEKILISECLPVWSY